jgi:hypothetical protein
MRPMAEQQSAISNLQWASVKLNRQRNQSFQPDLFAYCLLPISY